MTVEELIDYLTQFPPDAIVVYWAYSCPNGMEKKDIKFVTADQRLLCKHHNLVDTYYYRPYQLQVIDCLENPEWVTAVIFPGN